MPLDTIKPKAITNLDVLDLEKRNYVRWAESALDTFMFAGIREYVLGEVAKPATGDSDLPIWTKNNNLVQAGIRMNISAAERDYLRDHSSEKASTHTSLLNDLLGIHIERGTDMVKDDAKICDISAQVFETGTLDKDTLALAVLLRALSPELRSIRDKYEDDNTAKPADIVKSLEKEKLRWEEENKQKVAEERAHTARTQRVTSPPAKAPAKGLCGTCSGKHCTEDCWAEGGAMEGRQDEVIARRAARRKEAKQPEKPTTSTTPAAAKPGAKPRFAMRDQSGKTVYFTMVDDDAETAATVIHTRPRSDSESTVSSTFSMFAETEHFMFAIKTAGPEPFAADTGATVDISPHESDFYTFEVIDPIKIWGVRGTYIEALAKGDVHIRRSDGTVLIRRGVLYAPDASMRLMSIGRITDDGYVAAFAVDGFTITDPMVPSSPGLPWTTL
ncbi:hypothetical protein GGX14DRAFT_398345 [Mycena pura]|uniref:Retrovirus-related Pol polyprotein from transposon TNT 1-94-like beta-barrel domain-containing protein n=1 Tax=Mycena pura TaxID=153505 RepID=A0AAD6Y9Y2_9AGAR|nr:hypothetical protein GGX14DRAFT_398345 [Mycena pura]